ncbi:isochorismate synthase [Kitasatospora herbaricolor]|uniref:isochorismate synthase n=1 Tax=Kitasatospora herbaricolor TaxID=68217 RepID=A0ABZ1W5S3_9ACTN|nr:isochorismate synthase [Kitasatospora herbaricolor]
MTTAFQAQDAPSAALPAGGTLLAAYRPGPARAFFAGPDGTLLAEGLRRAVPDPASAGRLLAEARTAREDNPVVVGAIPFAPGRDAQLFIPAEVRRAGAVRESALPRPPLAPAAGRAWSQRPVPAPEAYRTAVAEAVRLMNEHPELSKVVLARTLELTAPGGADLTTMLHRLIHRDPNGYTFAVPAGGAATLVGASPELLLSRRGRSVVSNPLAGSAARSADPVEDMRRAAALTESPKDLAEHAFVVDAVRRTLEPYCADLVVPARPSLIRTAAMWHLSTTVTGTLRDAATSALDLALALHPTPAVCGTPTDRARELIGALEPFDRGLYTGVVGWGDATGDGEWVVTLRCAEAEGERLRLFAGAGVVAASVPEHELAETGAKFRTFLHAVGLEDAK